ncbi:hypothetical protein HDU87_008096 [Geranomyces variabilis]|uniref:Uncharacterized protein n=1 Tax=Geranomyces variabilis TaxID=109894 RepID=A0AAD5TP98_9FUNG|nr:hypothetical protein HDU87_008096 [Geranomyces variabilis]
MAAGYTVNKTLTFVAVLGGMFSGSWAINRFLKPDMSIPDFLADPAADPKVQKANRLKELQAQAASVAASEQPRDQKPTP